MMWYKRAWPHDVVQEGMATWCGTRGHGHMMWYKRAWPHDVVQEGMATWCDTRGHGHMMWYKRAWPHDVVQEGMATWCDTRGHGHMMWYKRAWPHDVVQEGMATWSDTSGHGHQQSQYQEWVVAAKISQWEATCSSSQVTILIKKWHQVTTSVLSVWYDCRIRAHICCEFSTFIPFISTSSVASFSWGRSIEQISR